MIIIAAVMTAIIISIVSILVVRKMWVCFCFLIMQNQNQMKEIWRNGIDALGNKFIASENGWCRITSNWSKIIRKKLLFSSCNILEPTTIYTQSSATDGRSSSPGWMIIVNSHIIFGAYKDSEQTEGIITCKAASHHWSGIRRCGKLQPEREACI